LDRLQGMAVFVRVAEQGSFSTAARQLGLSKSAVSKHVTALEERLGVRLINRTTRRLALTDVGAAYRDYCARIVQEVEEAELTAARHGVEPRGRLKVNAPMTFGFLHLGPLLPEFLARHPAVEVELTLNDRIVDLLEEGYDVAVRIGRLVDSSLVARRLATAGFLCAASAAYLARVGGNLRANNGDALRAAAVEGPGVVHLPDFIVGRDIQSGRLQRLLGDWEAPEIPIHAVFPPQRHPSAKLRAFVDFLVERLGRKDGWGAAAARRRAAAPAREAR
jgi:DNA-binding transcriptional LysR family regulator